MKFDKSVEPMESQELGNDQRRVRVNTQQRYSAWREARARAASYRGSLVWHEMKGAEYLVRSYYDTSGNRRQKSEGKCGPETEAIKAAWDRGRVESAERLKAIRDAVTRQAAINRAIGLARVSLIGARIIRAIDDAGLLGSRIRVVGINAIHAYEAAAGVMVDPGITATQDIDLLLDARMHLRISANDGIPERTLMALLKQVDRSLVRTPEIFRAANSDGYLVDLIRPLRHPSWLKGREQIGDAEGEPSSAAIEGLAWLESAPSFETIATDERGGPLRIVAIDPRVFAAHKLWLSQRSDREPTKRRLDAVQAEAAARLVTRYLTNLPNVAEELRMIPRALFEQARPLFDGEASRDAFGF